jgi:hypothetical protein
LHRKTRSSPCDTACSEVPGSYSVLSDSSSITAPSLLHKHTRSKGPFLRRHYPASSVSGRRWRIRLPSRWPPSAAQTWCAVFPRHAFTKTQTTRYDAGPTEWGRLRTCQVDPVHQSPRTMMYGFFQKELIHLIALTRLTSLLFLPAFVCRLPRPTPVADRSVTRLSPCLKYYSAVRLLTEHRSPLRFRL